MRRLQVGETVIRTKRLLKTHGHVIEVSKGTRDGVRLLWIKWLHSTTRPNPSLELEDELDRVMPLDLQKGN